MAISSIVSALQGVESSVSTRLSVVGVSIPISSTTTILGISNSMEDRILGIDDRQSSLSSKLSDLESLRVKLLALNTAAARLENLTSTGYTGAVDLTGSDAGNDTIEIDDNELGTAGISIETGDMIRITSNASAGVSLNTTYYVNVVEDSGDVTLKLYTSRSAAIAGGASGLVDITANGWTSGVGDVFKTDLDDPTVEDLFDAFNEVQEFLEEITGSGGSLEGERALSQLGQQLTNAMRGLLTSSDLLPFIEDSSDTRALTLDTSDLSTYLTTEGNYNKAALLFEGSGGVANKLQNVVNNYAGPSGVINSLITSLQTSTRDSDGDIATLLQRAQADQVATVKNLASIAGSLTTSSRQISFLEALFA